MELTLTNYEKHILELILPGMSDDMVINFDGACYAFIEKENAHFYSEGRSKELKALHDSVPENIKAYLKRHDFVEPTRPGDRNNYWLSRKGIRLKELETLEAYYHWEKKEEDKNRAPAKSINISNSPGASANHFEESDGNVLMYSAINAATEPTNIMPQRGIVTGSLKKACNWVMNNIIVVLSVGILTELIVQYIIKHFW